MGIQCLLLKEPLGYWGLGLGLGLATLVPPGSWDPASARHFSDLGVYGGTGTWGFRGETGHGLCHCFDAQLSTL